jgi:hypothetical protein
MQRANGVVHVSSNNQPCAKPSAAGVNHSKSSAGCRAGCKAQGFSHKSPSGARPTVFLPLAWGRIFAILPNTQGLRRGAMHAQTALVGVQVPWKRLCRGRPAGASWAMAAQRECLAGHGRCGVKGRGQGVDRPSLLLDGVQVMLCGPSCLWRLLTCALLSCARQCALCAANVTAQEVAMKSVNAARPEPPESGGAPACSVRWVERALPCAIPMIGPICIRASGQS